MDTITDDNFGLINDSDWVNVIDEADGTWTMGEASGGATDSFRNRASGHGNMTRLRNGHWANTQRLYDGYSRRMR